METKEKIKRICALLEEVLIAKNQNYGDSAFRTPLLAPNVSPQEALLTRFSDKIWRMERLLRGEPDRVKESLDDTILDVAGYCILLLIERSLHGDAETEWN